MPVQAQDRRLVGVEVRGHERLAAFDPNQREEPRRRHRRVAADIDRVDDIPGSAVDEEDNEQLVAALDAISGDLSLPVPLPVQIRENPPLRVLDEIEIGGPLPLDRDEVVHAIVGKAIALEHDSNQRPARNGQRDVHRAPLVALVDQPGDARLVVALPAQRTLPFLHASIQLGRIEWTARTKIQPSHELVPVRRLDALEVDVADHGARPGLDAHDHDGPVGIVPGLEIRLYAGSKEAAVFQELLDRPGRGVRTCRRRRRPEPLGHVAAQVSFGQAEIAAEVDALDDMDRNQVVAEGNAGRCGFGVHLDVLEPAQAEQVADRLANVGHHERAASRPALDEVGERRVGGHLALRSRPGRTRRSGPQMAPLDSTVLSEGGRQRDGAGQESDDGGSHQKVWRTRKSIAKVPSSLRETTYDTRSL